MGIGMVLICVRERLVFKPGMAAWRKPLLWLLCIVSSLTMLLCIWVVIPRTNWGGGAITISFITTPAWCAVAYGEVRCDTRERVRVAAFVVAWLLCAGFAATSPVANFGLVLLMATIDHALPEYDCM